MDRLLELIGTGAVEALVWRRRHPHAYAALLRARSAVAEEAAAHWAQAGRPVLSRIARRRAERLDRRARKWARIGDRRQ